MKPSEILKEAEKYLWDGLDDSLLPIHICFAIGEVEQDKDVDAEFLTDYIEQALEGFGSAAAWLREQPGGIPDTRDVYIQAWRLNWMRRMQKYFRSIGQ